MSEVTGLKRFANMFPGRFFDVGIAEGHAVTFAAGLALGGLIPVFAVYSSFLQRGYDQLLHDVCMQELHVIFAIDRAGLVGADGKSHQGCFDLSYLSMMPHMTVMAPKNKWELSDMMKFAVHFHGPIALRYPRGEAYTGLEQFRAPIEYGKAEVIREGREIALLAVGSMVRIAEEAADRLEEMGISVTLVNVRFVKPFDRELLKKLSETHSVFVTMEENVRTGGFGQQVLDYAEEEKLPVTVSIAAVPDTFVSHGSVEWQRKQVGLDTDSILERIEKLRTGQENRT